MRILIAALGLLVAVAPASAISRYNAASMSCDKARATVDAEGAVILRFRSTINPSIRKYGRFVVDGRFCAGAERAELSYIPTADTNSCPVYECKPYSVEDDFELFLR